MTDQNITPFAAYLSQHKYSARHFSKLIRMNIHTILRVAQGKKVWKKTADRIIEFTNRSLNIEDFNIYTTKGLKKKKKAST